MVMLCACGDDEPGFNAPVSDIVCNEAVSVTDDQTPFMVTLDGESWSADSLVSAGYQNDIFVLEAISRSIQDSVIALRIQIEEPVEAVNTFDLMSTSKMLFILRNDRFILTEAANCGFVNLSELNLANNKASGTFQANINSAFEEIGSFDITNGIFNDLTLSPLLCEPDYQINTGTYDLFREWQMIGIYDAAEELVSYPLCGTSTTIGFTDSEENNNRIITVAGNTGINDFNARVFNFREGSFTIANFQRTLIPSLPFETLFEGQFVQLLADNDVTFSIEGNILTIAYAPLGRELRFVAVE